MASMEGDLLYIPPERKPTGNPGVPFYRVRGAVRRVVPKVAVLGGGAAVDPSSPIYYVSNAGDDAKDGLSQANAWKTIAKINGSTFQPGDQVLFKKGETWRETVLFPSSGSAGNPITFGSYGSGAKPRVLGSDVPASWNSESYLVAPTLSKVQDGAVASLSGSATRTFASTPTSGRLLIAIGWGTTADSNASLSGSGWTKAVATTYTSSKYMAIWYKTAGASEPTGVTLTWTSSTDTAIYTAEWSGLISPVLDKVASSGYSSAATSKTSGTTSDTTKNYEIAIAVFGHGASVTARSYSNSFTETHNVGGSDVLQTAHLTTATTGALETTQSWTTSRIVGGMIATFGGTETGTSLYYTAQTADPVTVWFIDTGDVVHTGNKVASKSLLLADYDWWWDSGNNRLYINAASDPLTRYHSVEVSSTTRDRGLWGGTGAAVEYIVVDDLEIAYITGVGSVVRSYSSITNCHIHHIGYETGGHSYGAEINAGVSSRIANNIIHDTLNAGVLLTGNYAPYHISNNIIENNTIYDCTNYLVLSKTDANTAEDAGNIIRFNNLYHSSGYVLGSGYGYGIDIIGKSGVTCDAFQICYNIIKVQKAALYVQDYVTGAAVYNNSLISTAGQALYVSNTGSSGILLKNNIVASAALYALNILDKAVIAACDYNAWYAPGGTAYARVNGTNYTVAAFATYKSDTGFDTHGLWEDPLITNASTPDFTLQNGSPCINAGVSVGLSLDYAGAAVGNPPEIGAYEK